jgi:hypothetical protein
MADAHLHAQLGEIVFICKDLHICSNIVFSTILAERRSKSKNENPILIHISRNWRNVECKN